MDAPPPMTLTPPTPRPAGSPVSEPPRALWWAYTTSTGLHLAALLALTPCVSSWDPATPSVPERAPLELATLATPRPRASANVLTDEQLTAEDHGTLVRPEEPPSAPETNPASLRPDGATAPDEDLDGPDPRSSTPRRAAPTRDLASPRADGEDNSSKEPTPREASPTAPEPPALQAIRPVPDPEEVARVEAPPTDAPAPPAPTPDRATEDPAAPPPTRLTYVHAEGTSAEPHDLATDLIAAADARAPDEHRTLVRGPEEGEPRPDASSAEPRPKRDGVRHPVVAPRSRSGDDPVRTARTATQAPGQAAATGAPDADDAPPSEPLERPLTQPTARPETPAIATAAATPTRRAERGGDPSIAQAEGLPVAPDGTRPPGLAHAAPPSPMGGPHEAMDETARPPVAPQAQQAPTQVVAMSSPPPSTEDLPTARLGDGTGRAPGDGTGDVADALVETMGWGELARLRQVLPQAQPGAHASVTLDPGSGQSVLSEQVALGEVTRFTARGTALGRYLAQVEQAIKERWFSRDLSVTEKVLGVRGNVRVAFEVRRNGKVRDVGVSGSSGHPSLDVLALSAVPDRLPPIPREVGARVVRHELVLRYLNAATASAAGTRSR